MDRRRRQVAGRGLGALALALAATGCSAEAADELGVAIDEVTGQIEVLSICSDRGLASVAVVEADVPLDAAWFWSADHRAPGRAPAESMVVGFADRDYREVTTGGELEPFASVHVGVGYEGTDAVLPDVLVVPDRIGADEVHLLAGADGAIGEGAIVTRAEFEDRRHRCGPPAIGTAVAVTVPLAIVASIVVIGVRSIVVRRRGRS